MSMERLTIRDMGGTYFISPIGRAFPASELRVATVQVLLDRLAAYEDAEEAGLLIRLPCKAGDTIYHIENLHWFDSTTKCVREREFRFFMLNENGALDDGYYLTREEAEAALAKEG